MTDELNKLAEVTDELSCVFVSFFLIGTVKKVVDVSIKRNGESCLGVVVLLPGLLQLALLLVGSQQLLFLDGTFGICPKGTQLVVCMIHLPSGYGVPIGYLVTSGRSETDYGQLLAELVRRNVQPIAVMIDFELVCLQRSLFLFVI